MSGQREWFQLGRRRRRRKRRRSTTSGRQLIYDESWGRRNMFFSIGDYLFVEVFARRHDP